HRGERTREKKCATVVFQPRRKRIVDRQGRRARGKVRRRRSGQRPTRVRRRRRRRQNSRERRSACETWMMPFINSRRAGHGASPDEHRLSDKGSSVCDRSNSTFTQG